MRAVQIFIILRSESNVGEVVSRPLDLASLDSVRKCAKDLLEEEKRIDLLVLNAGTGCPISPYQL
jgi:short-subunit dehydrogenase